MSSVAGGPAGNGAVSHIRHSHRSLGRHRGGAPSPGARARARSRRDPPGLRPHPGPAPLPQCLKNLWGAFPALCPARMHPTPYPDTPGARSVASAHNSRVIFAFPRILDVGAIRRAGAPLAPRRAAVIGSPFGLPVDGGHQAATRPLQGGPRRRTGGRDSEGLWTRPLAISSATRRRARHGSDRSGGFEKVPVLTVSILTFCPQIRDRCFQLASKGALRQRKKPLDEYPKWLNLLMLK